MILIMGYQSRLTGSLQVLLQVDTLHKKIHAEWVRKVLPQIHRVVK